jgi:hypothetical protein
MAVKIGAREMDKSFDEWFKDLQKVYDSHTSIHIDLDKESFRMFYNSDFTPEDAYEEEQTS